jgi:hypothetical protein
MKLAGRTCHREDARTLAELLYLSKLKVVHHALAGMIARACSC